MTATVVVGIDTATKCYTTFLRFNGTYLAWVQVPNTFVAQTADGEFYILPGANAHVQVIPAVQTEDCIKPALLAHPLQCLLEESLNKTK